MHSPNNHNIVSQNQAVTELLSNAEKIAKSDCTVLLVGETGVGKELFAEYIHRYSERNHNPLVKIALSTLPRDLLESELFGYERGSFTGSMHEKKGLFEFADKGTVYLDDIDDFPLNLQPKLLRVLEAKEIKRIGAQQSIPLDIRLIASTKINLKTLVAQEKFRMDLFFRINVFPIEIPPLRERSDDIPLLIKYFLHFYEPNRTIDISEAAMHALTEYYWPGNIRELKNVIQRIALFVDGKITLENLPSEMRGDSELEGLLRKCSACFQNKNMNFEQVMSCVESQLLEHALKSADRNRTLAARMLGLSLSTFRDKLKKHNLD
jgi:Nif-specific regulatory protein